MAPDVEGGLFVLASVDGEPAAVAKFQLSDPEFWPAQPSGESTFIHGLAVRRRYAGTGVSSALIDWAVEVKGLSERLDFAERLLAGREKSALTSGQERSLPDSREGRTP